MKTTHPLIKEYLSNKDRHNRHEWAAMVCNRLFNDHSLKGKNDPLFKAIQPFLVFYDWEKQDCQNPLWRKILSSLEDVPKNDLEVLVDEMPSGWPRAKIMDYLDSFKEKP